LLLNEQCYYNTAFLFNYYLIIIRLYIFYVQDHLRRVYSSCQACYDFGKMQFIISSSLHIWAI